MPSPAPSPRPPTTPARQWALVWLPPAALALGGVARGQDAEPPTLAALDSMAPSRPSGTLSGSPSSSGPALAAGTFSIELPSVFQSRTDLGPFVAFDAGFGAPRFYVSRAPEEGAFESIEGSRADYELQVERGERGEGLAWASRVSRMRRHALRAQRRTMRPLPPGERTWVELQVVALLTTPDGTRVRCAADIVPFSRARHGTTEAARDWLLDRCASIRLDPVRP